MRVAWIGLALCLTALQPAAAHVTLADREAVPGSFYRATFRVPHGCAGAATTGLEVRLPPSVVIAKPMPKPGWTLSITRAPLEEPVIVEGHPHTERVARVTWQNGRLADEDYDEFVLFLRLPNTAGPLYFPTVQYCDGRETDFVEVPTAGQALRDIKYPPPYVVLVPQAH